MPNKHFYVALGAASGVIAAYMLHRHLPGLRRRWPVLHRFCLRHPDGFLWYPMLGLPFIVWALLPDLLHASALLPKTVTRGPLFDLFYLHSSFERWEDLHPRLDHVLNTVGSLLLLLIGLGNFVFYVRIWHRRAEVARRRRCDPPRPVPRRS